MYSTDHIPTPGYLKFGSSYVEPIISLPHTHSQYKFQTEQVVDQSHGTLRKLGVGAVHESVDKLGNRKESKRLEATTYI